MPLEPLVMIGPKTGEAYTPSGVAMMPPPCPVQGASQICKLTWNAWEEENATNASRNAASCFIGKLVVRKTRPSGNVAPYFTNSSASASVGTSLQCHNPRYRGSAIRGLPVPLH